MSNHNPHYSPGPHPTTPSTPLPTSTATTSTPTTTTTTTTTSMNNANDPAVLDLLANYPFIQYTPGSRVAKHLQSLNITRPSSYVPYPSSSITPSLATPSSSLPYPSYNPSTMTTTSDPKLVYPQYRETFERMDRVLGDSGVNVNVNGGVGAGQSGSHEPMNMGFEPQPLPYAQTPYPPYPHQAQAQAQAQPSTTTTFQPQPPFNPQHPPSSIHQSDQALTQSNIDRAIGYMNDLAPIYGFGGIASRSSNGVSSGHGGIGGGAGSWVGPGLGRNGLAGGKQVKDRIDLTRSGSFGQTSINPFYEPQMGYGVAPTSGRSPVHVQTFHQATENRSQAQPQVQVQARQPVQVAASPSSSSIYLEYNPSAQNALGDLIDHVRPPSTLNAFATTGYGLNGVGEGWDGNLPSNSDSNSMQQPTRQYRPPPSSSMTNSSAPPSPFGQPTYHPNDSRAFFEGYLNQVEGRRQAELDLAKAKELERAENERKERQRVMRAQEEREREVKRVLGHKPPSVSPQKRRVEDVLMGEGGKKSKGAGTGGAGLRLVPFVEIPLKKAVKMGGYRSMDEDDDDMDDDDDEDDGGDGDYRDYHMNRSGRRLSDSGMAMMTPDNFKTDGTPTRRNGWTSVAGRSGKKDHHKALWKFVEDVYEAEDGLPADLAQEDLPSGGPFDRLTRRARQDEKPLLRRSAVEKLSAMFKQCTRSKNSRGKRSGNTLRDAQNGSIPDNLANWPTEELTRLVKLLERNMIEIEGIVVFPDDGYSARANKDIQEDSPKDKSKPVKKKVRANKADSEDVAVTVHLSTHDMEAAIDKLDVLIDAVVASECVMSLLTADDLAKPLYSEDVIREALEAASLTINEIIMPFVEGLSGTSSISSSLLAYVALQTDDSARRIRQSILVLTKSTTRLLHRITRLIAHEGLTLPENLVYSITQIVVQLVFVVDPMTESKSGPGARSTAIWKEAMEGQAGTRALRAEAMEVLKTLYLHQGSAEREDILKEVLAFTAKVADLKRNQTGFRTRKGKVIHFISALLLELMQTSAHGVKDMLDAADVAEMTDMGDEVAQKPESKLNTTALAAFIEDINRSARFILQYMLNKLSAAHVGKQKSSLEINYRNILETFLEDQIEVLYLPEFPAAAISLGMTARTLISILDENKPTADNATIRGLAIDHLGSLASSLRNFEMTYNGGAQAFSLQQIVRTGNLSAWRELRDASQVLLHTLQKNALQNGLYSSAADVMTAEWLLNLHRTLKREDTGDSDDGADLDDEMTGGASPILREIQTELIRASRKVEDESVFAHAKDDLLAQADRPCIMVEMTRELQYALVHISKTILNCMSAPVVAQRTKAIRALGAGIAVDPVLLNRADIRKSIQDRISDSSPAVRDAAIDLVGKYIPDKPDVALQYYPSISSRIADTGPAVRKRVVKLFKVIYDLVSKKSVRTEICCKLVGLVDDEEDSVKDLALATLAEIWFPADERNGGQQNKRSDTPVSTTSSKDATEYQVHPIVDVVARYSNDMLPVELAIREISKDNSRGLPQEYSRLIGIMLDRLIAEDSRSASETLPLVRSIHLLSNAKPQAMDLQRATSLLPYLRQASTPEEVILCETLMRIFRTSIPCLPKSASNFAVELSKILLPMIAKPSGRLSTLEEAVMCYCAVVTHLTQEYSRILTILKSCIRKIRAETVKAEKSRSKMPTDQKTLPFIATIAALLVAKSDLDAVKEGRTEVDEAIYDMTGNDDVSISIYLFETLLGLWNLNLDQVMRHAVIQCFGHVYQAFPTLMTHERSIAVMDSVLKGETANHHTTLKMFTLIHDTLSNLVESSQNRNGGEENGSDPVDMDKLIGNTAGFAESGVGSAIIQRYIDKVLHAALSSDNDIQKVAIDILSLTINQGLAHPIQSFPIIVTLETSDSLHVSEKAFGLHSHLQAKHASIINSRYFESAKVVFDYRKGIDPEAIGYSKSAHPTALLDRWYSLIRDKRPIRQDFLKAMCKAFTFEISPPKVTWDDVLLARFMAENLALLEYKVQEEVLQIVSAMTTLLASLGMQVVELLKGTKIVGQGHANLTEANLIKDDENGDEMEQDDSQASQVDYNVEALINASAMVGIALLLKNRLKKTYGLTEDKIVKYQPGKKTVVADRSVTKKITDGSAGLPDWELLPGVKSRVINVKGYQDQAIAFLNLIEEDGTMRPEYDSEDAEEEDYQGKA